MPENIYDGFVDVVLDGVEFRLRCNHLIVKPFLPEPEKTILCDDGIERELITAAYLGEIPTYFSEVMAVAGPALGTPDLLPQVGDIVVSERYATEQINAPCLCQNPHHDLPMAAATRGLHWLNLKDVRAILE